MAFDFYLISSILFATAFTFANIPRHAPWEKSNSSCSVGHAALLVMPLASLSVRK
jgi:hypothetical protein